MRNTTMRELLGGWSAGLDDQQLARALLGLGLIPRRSRRAGDAALDALWLALAKTREEILVWRLDELPGDIWWKLPHARKVSEIIEAASVLGTLRVALRLGSPLSTRRALEFLQSQLYQTAALHIAGRTVGRRYRFRWPLRIGIVPGPEAAALSEALAARDSWGGMIYRVINLSRRHPECDLLIASAASVEAAHEAIHSCAAELDGLTADIVMLFDSSSRERPSEASREWDLKALDAVRASVAAGGIAVLESEDEGGAILVRNTCIELAHAAPFDVALGSATSGRALLMAERSVLQATRLKNKARVLARSLSQRAQAHVNVQPGALGPWGDMAIEAVDAAAPARATRGAVGARLEERLDSFEWLRESDQASELGHIIVGLDEEDAAEAQPRYLQAAFVAPDAPEAPLPGPLEPDTDYGVTVLIDAATTGFLSVGVEFPPLPEPDDGRAHELVVVFWEPRLSPEPQIDRIELPPRGPSSRCTFKLHTDARREPVEARITILHRNRVLQTGRLTAPVGSDGEPAFRLDAVPRRLLNALDERLNFSLALVLNETEVGGAAHVMEGDKSVVLDVDNDAIQKLVSAISQAISRITSKPADYEGLRAEGSVKLLRTLAQKGASLRAHLTRHAIRSGRLEPPQLVQVVATRAGKTFPLEFIYQHQAPLPESKICPSAELALTAGACPATCPSHDQSPDAMANTICPLGFWGLRCAIERVAHVPEHNDLRGPFVLQMEPVRKDNLLRPLAGTLVGATSKANLAVPTAVSDMMLRIKALVPGASQVGTWEEWVATIAAEKPATLTLLVHQEQDENGTATIDIGSQPYLLSDLVQKGHVIGPDSTAPPLVLLIGCETGLAEIDYESFAVRFKDEGAAFVVSTIAQVLGRQAAPMAAEILEAIKGVQERTSFAVVMRDLRRRLLAGGSPMVLALSAYGDADWDVVG
jgi:hypothetical protein